jgi:hypothetical protein
MTAITLRRTRLDPVGALLAPVHARWLDEVRRNVMPACHPRAVFWSRWSAVRYLADRFARDFALEGELLDAVIGGLDPGVAARLVKGREILEELWRDLDRIGRRRGTGAATAAMAGAFLLTLARWCTELEAALSTVHLDDLTPQAAALVHRMRQVRAGGHPRAPGFRPATAVTESARA